MSNEPQKFDLNLINTEVDEVGSSRSSGANNRQSIGEGKSENDQDLVLAAAMSQRKASEHGPKTGHLSVETQPSTLKTRTRKNSGSFDCMHQEWPRASGTISVTLSVKKNQRILKWILNTLEKVAYELHRKD